MKKKYMFYLSFSKAPSNKLEFDIIKLLERWDRKVVDIAEVGKARIDLIGAIFELNQKHIRCKSAIPEFKDLPATLVLRGIKDYFLDGVPKVSFYLKSCWEDK